MLLFNICAFEASAPLWGHFMGSVFVLFAAHGQAHIVSACHMIVTRMLVGWGFESTPYELYYIFVGSYEIHIFSHITCFVLFCFLINFNG